MKGAAAEYLIHAINGHSGPLPQGVSWADITALADRGRVEPMVLRGLGERVPEGDRKQMKRGADKAAFVGLRALQERDALLQGLEDAGVAPVVLLKGAVLGWLVYPDPLLRPMHDVDFLVTPDALTRVGDVLQEQGYRAIKLLPTGGLLDNHEQVWAKDLVPGKVVQVMEPHTAFAQRYRYSVPYDELLNRVIRFPQGGRGAYRLEDNDQLIHLAIHLACNKFLGPLKHLLDVHLWIEQRNLDWGVLIERARSWGAATSLGVSLWLAQEVFGTRIPVEVLDELTPRGLRRRFLRWVHAAADGRMTRRRLNTTTARLFTLLPMLDSPAQRARFVACYMLQKLRNLANK